jgi:hypothetical protein
VIRELATMRANLTSTLAVLANTTTELASSRALVESLSGSLTIYTNHTFRVELSLYASIAAFSLEGLSRFLWLHFKKGEIFPLDK